jgi:RNA polymerase sigma factor (sigma-70 family)
MTRRGGVAVTWGEELATLIRERGSASTGYAYLLTGNTDTAQDLVREALVRAYGRPRSRPDLEWVEAYVRRVVLDVYLDTFHRNRLWDRVRHMFLTPETAPDGGDHPAATTADHVDVQTAFAQLPPPVKACVVLRYHDDLTVPALAERLGMSPGAAKRHLSDGIQRMGGMLGPVPDHETADVEPIGSGLR